MSEWITLEEIDATAAFIKSKTKYEPKVAIILGSGLGGLADAIADADVIPTAQIPNWPVSTVQGHAGQLVIGKLEGQIVMVLKGRAHYYEGHSMQRVTFPIRVMQRMEIPFLVVTNAAGAVNPEFNAGDVMLITDHIAMIGMAGLNPLRGPNLDTFGERFPDMSQAYDRELLTLARKVAAEKNVVLREGVYTCLAGPSFESPADLRFLQVIGSDAVGMSTVPEVIIAHHGKTRVLGLSGISNKANLDGSTITTHEEVLEAGKVLVPKMTALIRGILQQLPK